MVAKSVSAADGQDTCISIDATGLLAGSRVLTLDGEVPVEALCAGARVITRDRGMAVLRGVEHDTVHTDAVRIMAGTLGHMRPDHDVVLPAAQPVLIRDWRAEALFGAAQAMVPVRRLVDGEFIAELGPQVLMLYALRFDAPHVIYADGLELGTGPLGKVAPAAV